MSLAVLDKTLRSVPFIEMLGIRVEESRPGHVVLRLPYSRAVTNHAGGMHTAAVFAVGELAAAVAVGTHPELARLVQLQKSTKIKYFLQSGKDITAHATVTPEMVRKVRDALGSVQPSVEVPVSVHDGHGKDIAELVTHFSFRAR